MNALVSENSGLREEVVHLNDVIKQVAGAEDETDILSSNRIAFNVFDSMQVSKALLAVQK